MPKKQATKRKPAQKGKGSKSKRATAPHVYRMPKTAAELNIVCAVCGEAAAYFDHERAKKNHMDGFVCGNESRSAGSEKLLVERQRSGEREGLAQVASS
ncbi:MAG TPA: hypothetical protein VJX74_16190 [Blastocatellia bacterium]|nr:hypothetical protein [Blastocatellia bacterium]